MAITRTTLRLLDGMRLTVNRPVDAAAQAIITAWGTAWNEVAGEWEAAIADLVDASNDSRWPSRTAVLRAQRAQNALKVTREALLELGNHLPVTVTQSLPTLTADAARLQADLTASQYPPAAGGSAQVAATFTNVDADALAAIVTRTTDQVTALSRPLSRRAEQAMRAVLIRGVAIGENPRRAAATMLQRVNGAFDGGRNRALVIARTEMLDAHRAAAAAHDAANSEVLAGWQWTCTLDKRTCPSCWAKHGEMHDLSEAGPNDHQQGRCTRLTVTKTWRQLGFDIDEPESLLPDAQATFGALSREDQLAVMGPKRLELLDSGKVQWSDLAQKRTTAGWRDSWAPTPVSDLAS